MGPVSLTRSRASAVLCSVIRLANPMRAGKARRLASDVFFAVACHQPVKPGSPIFVQWIKTGDSLASEQPFDAIDVLNSHSQQVGAFT